MENNRITEEYRGHKLLSAFHEGRFKGRIWKSKELLTEIEGDGIDDVLSKLRDYVDTRFTSLAEKRTDAPGAVEYRNAFQNIISRLPEGYLAMLKAHYLADKQEITATELAEAAGYANYSAANLHYGLLGKKLYEELPMNLPKRSDGSMIYTFALAIAGNKSGPEKHWVWKLREEVSLAIEQLGINV